MRNLLLIALGLAAITAGCSDWTYGRDLEGRIVTQGSRFKAGAQGSGGTEKVSIVVAATKPDAKIKEVACGPSGCAIECTSTRCASLVPDSCHRFACKYLYRFNEPDVIACKHAKEVECPAGATVRPENARHAPAGAAKAAHAG